MRVNLLNDTLESLRARAEEEEALFRNELGAAGIRYAVQTIDGLLQAEKERLVGPDEAAAYSGLSKRQLRRIAANHGRPRSPLYRLSELPIKQSGAAWQTPHSNDGWRSGVASTEHDGGGTQSSSDAEEGSATGGDAQHPIRAQQRNGRRLSARHSELRVRAAAKAREKPAGSARSAA